MVKQKPDILEAIKGILDVKSKLPKDFNGDPCYACFEFAEHGVSEERINNSHKVCHNWFHCGVECCGTCSVCGK